MATFTGVRVIPEPANVAIRPSAFFGLRLSPLRRLGSCDSCVDERLPVSLAQYGRPATAKDPRRERP